jgi:hypothetical protein
VTVRDDIRRSFGHRKPPEWHQAKLDSAAASLWRLVWIVLLLAVLAGLLELVGAA